jgi:hypothetical protein
MKGRKHELNLDPNFDPLDPAQVSDPKCWITGAAAEALKQRVAEKISVLRGAPLLTRTESELDLVDKVEMDAAGKYRLKDAG